MLCKFVLFPTRITSVAMCHNGRGKRHGRPHKALVYFVHAKCLDPLSLKRESSAVCLDSTADVLLAVSNPGKEKLVNRGAAGRRSVTALSSLEEVLNNCWVVGPASTKPAVKACSGLQNAVGQPQRQHITRRDQAGGHRTFPVRQTVASRPHAPLVGLAPIP